MTNRLWFLGALLLISCGKKVDCDKFNDRVKSCADTFSKRLAPKKTYDATQLDTLLQKKLLRACRGRGGKVGDAGKINDCLSRKGCDGFADCILGIKGASK